MTKLWSEKKNGNASARSLSKSGLILRPLSAWKVVMEKANSEFEKRLVAALQEASSVVQRLVELYDAGPRSVRLRPLALRGRERKLQPSGQKRRRKSAPEIRRSV